MNELARSVIQALRAGQERPELVERAGANRPEDDWRALVAAADHPVLASHLEDWLPSLLSSADPGAGARRLEVLVRDGVAARELAGGKEHALLGALAGNSAFLSQWLCREPRWLRDLSGEMPPAPEAPSRPLDWEGLRRQKYRGLLRIAGRDTAGRPFEAGLRELSELADSILRRALELAAGDGPAPALFCLGKLGGRELNFSSDVDLLFVCDAEPDAHGAAAREAAGRAIRELKRRLEERTETGFGYRVDLDLRPEGPSGDLVRSVDGTLAYYELRGAAWEQQMLLRLRHLAGAPAAAAEFERAIEPFVYPRAVDPRAIGRVRAMKQRIERERRAAGRDPSAELKEGPGGIRDVEFTVQALQLFHAGRNPSLRTGNVLEAIRSLASMGLLPDDSARDLEAGYLWLRRAEHALQLPEEQQTARLPSKAAARTGVARRMGYTEPEASEALSRFERDASEMRGRVREHFEDLVLEDTET